MSSSFKSPRDAITVLNQDRRSTGVDDKSPQIKCRLQARRLSYVQQRAAQLQVQFGCKLLSALRRAGGDRPVCDVVGVAVADRGDELLQHRQQHTSAGLAACECLATSPAASDEQAQHTGTALWSGVSAWKVQAVKDAAQSVLPQKHRCTHAWSCNHSQLSVLCANG